MKERKPSSVEKRALQYIRNAGVGATVEHFIEDYEPIGPNLLLNLRDSGWAHVVEDNLVQRQ